jgi:hypothetical protein
MASGTSGTRGDMKADELRVDAHALKQSSMAHPVNRRLATPARQTPSASATRPNVTAISSDLLS